MVEAPSGTLTFLFTDLEVSTRLWDEEPDAMRRALARHDAILREVVAEHGGHVVKGTGDGIHAVFTTADGAVGAAVAAQQALHSEAWEPGEPLRVRMGIHAGVAELRDGDYFGSEVNRAARVMAVANGGQVICTRVVEELVGDGVGLVDLGEHRLRDLRSSAHLFQVEVPGVSGEHPPLRSLDAYRSNLPYESSSFIGRADELREVSALLARSRVVSIVGVGGVGKTRLALQVGSHLLPHYEDGVWLCELASVTEPDDVYDAIATAVQFTPPQGVPVIDGLPRFFHGKELLLVLDNCEHLVRAVSAFVAETTTHSERVSVLATSREPLGVRGEHITPLAPLGVSTVGDAPSVLASEAGALFVARAREARGSLDVDDSNAQAVLDVCTRLDGIPLALELAAARTAVMSPAEISSHLDRQFRLLTGGSHNALERHQTLRAAIDWSYDLLTSGERDLFDRLSVCVGGFDLAAAAAIAARGGLDDLDTIEVLGSLVAKSLVERTERDGVTRYRMLEMMRQYAAERLDASQSASQTRDDHARHYLSRAVDLFGEARGRNEYDALERLELETPNIAAAARWLLDNERWVELLEFFGELPFVDALALPPATLDELATVADRIVGWPEVPTCRGLHTAAWLLGVKMFIDGDVDGYRRLAEFGERFEGDPVAWNGVVMASLVAMFDGDMTRGAEIAARAVERARQAGDPVALAWLLAHLSVMQVNRFTGTIGGGEGLPIDADSVASANEAVAIARRTGSQLALLYPLVGVMSTTRFTEPTRALEAADELVRIDLTRRGWWARVLDALEAEARMGEGADPADALRDWRQAWVRYRDNGERFLLSNYLVTFANRLMATHPELAVELAAIAESDAIVAVEAFTVAPDLAGLAGDHAAAIDAARGRARGMSYDEAVAFVLAALDRLIAEHEAGG